MPRVNPDILVWARETAGLAQDEAARKLSISEDRLKAMEEGEHPPTHRQLTAISEKYRRPLVTFYLPRRPLARNFGQDFRTLPRDHEPVHDALVSALLRDIQARQQLVRAAMEEADEAVRLDFVASADADIGLNRLVEQINEKIGYPISEYRAQRTVGDAFALLRDRVERSGVFVVLMGNLGTHHTDIDVKVFRGFALADEYAPFIVINEKDSRAAWSFTLLHELVHIWLGQTGISGYDSGVEIEKFCDAVASRILLDPRELFELDLPHNAPTEVAAALITAFANSRKISRKMVAYNLLLQGLINVALYRTLAALFDAERSAKRVEEEREGGPSYYIVKRHRVGHALLDFTRRMIKGGVLSTPRAGKVLGVKPTSVSQLVGLGND
jgi:Zn-dependent peptidase ImmA (M78 family)/transcriptional regulator with XRE-family HTH domain